MTTQKELALKESGGKIIDFVKARSSTFKDLLPATLTPERMIKGFIAASTRSPKLLECTPLSVLNALIISSSLGLEPGRIRGGMHIVPFFNKKTKQQEATAIPDYRGLMDLAYRSGQVTSIEARPVYEADQFEFQYGTEGFARHKPAMLDRGKLYAVYSVAKMKHGDPQFVVLPLEEVNEHRDRSSAWQWAIQNGKTDTPWHTDYLAMALKTSIRVLTNFLPQAPDDLRLAVEYESRIDRGASVDDLFPTQQEDIEIQGEQVEAEPKSSTIAAEKKMRKGKEPPPTPEPTQEAAQGPTGTKTDAADLDPAMGLIKRLEEAYSTNPEGFDGEWEAVKIGDAYTNVLSPIQQNEVWDAMKSMKEGTWA